MQKIDFEYVFYQNECLARIDWDALSDGDQDTENPIILWTLDYSDFKRQLVNGYYVQNLSKMLEIVCPPELIDTDEERIHIFSIAFF